MENYTLTVKFAGKGTLLSNGKTSSVGHIWVEVRSSFEREPYGSGWSTGDSNLIGGMDNISYTDHKNYIDTPENPISSITVPISKEQSICPTFNLANP